MRFEHGAQCNSGEASERKGIHHRDAEGSKVGMDLNLGRVDGERDVAPSRNDRTVPLVTSSTRTTTSTSTIVGVYPEPRTPNSNSKQFVGFMYSKNRLLNGRAASI